MKESLWKWDPKEVIMDLLYDILGSVLYGIGLYTFALNANFAPGGISGLSLIINHLTSLPIGLLIVALNIPMVIFSYRILGKVFLLKSIKTIIISSLILDLVFPLFPTYQGDAFLASIFTGVFVGAACAILYVRGTSTGGVDFMILGLKKKVPFLSVGQITLIIDGGIVLLGGIIYQNVDAVLFGVISAVAGTVVIDKLMLGASRGKLAIIITNDAMAAAKAISDSIDRGSTLVKGIGTYSYQEREMLFCACGYIQIYKLRQVVHKIDPNALVMITDANEVFGEGFLKHE